MLLLQDNKGETTLRIANENRSSCVLSVVIGFIHPENWYKALIIQYTAEKTSIHHDCERCCRDNVKCILDCIPRKRRFALPRVLDTIAVVFTL